MKTVMTSRNRQQQQQQDFENEVVSLKWLKFSSFYL